MSEGGEPADDRDWFRGVRPAGATRTPRPVAEAFGHLPKSDAGGDGDAEWFATDQDSDGIPVGACEPAPVSGLAERRAELREVGAAEQGPVPYAAAEPAAPAEPSAGPRPMPDLVAALADAADAAGAAPGEPAAPAPAPDTDSRVRLRALTGGLADLSDALAAIGVESVALRSSGPASPPVAPPPTAAADFRVRCPDCGPQYVAVADLRFVETGDGAEANRYLFTCPACGARVRRPAGPELAEILKSSGVATLALRRGPGQAL